MVRSAWSYVSDKVAPKADPYRYDPVAWVTDHVRWKAGQGLTGYQAEILGQIPAEERVSARGPHGLGKTTIAALATLWFSITRDMAGDDWKVPTTASAWRQLQHFLWPEIHKWAKLLDWDRIGRPPFNERTELLDLNLKLRHGQAFAMASDKPALIEGVHADHLLYVFDEAKTIIPATFDAAEGAFSGAGSSTDVQAYALAVSTPGEPVGRFYEIQSRKAGLEDWWPRHVTLAETLAAGRVSTEWAEQRARQWGEGSALYANRVLGDFHASDEDGVIPLAWVEAAVERWHAWIDQGRPNSNRLIVGVDVARSGEDQTVLAPRYGWSVGELRYSSKEGTVQTTSRVEAMFHGHHGDEKWAVVDEIGVGGGVHDQLRSDGFRSFGFVASRGTVRRDRSNEFGFANLRSAAWWNLRELLDPTHGEGLALPPDDMLTGDLTAPHWRVVAGGRIQVETKDEIKKRIGRSTDSGDAVMQAFWDELEPDAPVEEDWSDDRLDGRR